MRDTLTKMPGVVIAVVQGGDSEGRPLIRLAGETGKRARAAWMEHKPDWDACKGLEVIVGFEEGDEEKPIVLGFLQDPAGCEDRDAGEAALFPGTADTKPRVLRIESEKELILECGEAKISLRADGRVMILGGYVLSRSKGVNKIRGGSVHIN